MGGTYGHPHQERPLEQLWQIWLRDCVPETWIDGIAILVLGTKIVSLCLLYSKKLRRLPAWHCSWAKRPRIFKGKGKGTKAQRVAESNDWTRGTAVDTSEKRLPRTHVQNNLLEDKEPKVTMLLDKVNELVFGRAKVCEFGSGEFWALNALQRQPLAEQRARRIAAQVKLFEAWKRSEKLMDIFTTSRVGQRLDA